MKQLKDNLDAYFASVSYYINHVHHIYFRLETEDAGTEVTIFRKIEVRET